MELSAILRIFRKKKKRPKFADGRLSFEKTEFTESVRTLTPDDIAKPMTEGFDFTEIKPKLIKGAVMLVCAAVFCVSGGYIIKSISEYAKIDALNKQMQDEFYNVGTWAMEMPYRSGRTPDYATAQTIIDPSEFDPNEQLTEEERYARLRRNLKLFSGYKGVYGWIQVPGTGIDYIVMQWTDNDYFLDHDFTGSYSKGGAIFADYRCQKSVPANRNLILYGHHMTNSSMFHMLDRYTDKNFFDTNEYVLIHTLEGSYKYRIFAAYETTATYPYIRTVFANDKEFIAFAEEMKANSVWERQKVKFDKNSKILTLSTCTNTSDDGRIAVQAVLVEEYHDEDIKK